MTPEAKDSVSRLISDFFEAKKGRERSRLADALLDLHIQNAFDHEQLSNIAKQIIESQSLKSCDESVLHLLGSIVGYLEHVPLVTKPLEDFLGNCNDLTPMQLDGALTIIRMAKNPKHIPSLNSMYLYAGVEDRQTIQDIISEM